jgi:TonB family protein
MEWLLCAVLSGLTVVSNPQPLNTQAIPRLRVAPKKIKDVRPEPPPIAVSARVSGRVVADAVISPSGEVVSVDILCSIPLLDESVVRAMRQWQFAPTGAKADRRAILSTTVLLPAADSSVKPHACQRVDSKPARRVGGSRRVPRMVAVRDPEVPRAQLLELLKKEGAEQVRVIVEIEVAAEGYVSAVRVLRGYPLIDRLVTEAVEQWMYEPTIEDAAAIPIVFTHYFDFKR